MENNKDNPLCIIRKNKAKNPFAALPLRETRKLPVPLRAVFWKISRTQLFDFVFNSISLLWEKYLAPEHYTRQRECNSPYQRRRPVEEVSLSSLLWSAKVNLVTLRNFAAEQSGDNFELKEGH